MSSHSTPPSSPLKMAILDDYLKTSTPYFSTLAPDKLSTTVFTDTIQDHSALLSRLHPFHIISTIRERTPFPSSLLRHLPNLKLLLVTGPRHRTFDFDTARELGIVVGRAAGTRPSAPTRGAHGTVQHAWALILALVRNVAADDLSVKTGGWQTGLGTDLCGKTLGVVGLGKLGAAVARIAVLVWGMKVVAWSENLTQEKADDVAKGLGLPVEGEDGDGIGGKTFRAVSKEELFRAADIVSVHYVLSERSRGVVGKRELEWMKESAFLVNTSRGPLVDENALLDALEKGRIRGAALDVFDVEPLPADSRWRTTRWGKEGTSRVLLTPHTGYLEEETMHAWYKETAENVKRWIEGQEVLDRVV